MMKSSTILPSPAVSKSGLFDSDSTLSCCSVQGGTITTAEHDSYDNHETKHRRNHNHNHNNNHNSFAEIPQEDPAPNFLMNTGANSSREGSFDESMVDLMSKSVGRMSISSWGTHDDTMEDKLDELQSIEDDLKHLQDLATQFLPEGSSTVPGEEGRIETKNSNEAAAAAAAAHFLIPAALEQLNTGKRIYHQASPKSIVDPFSPTPINEGPNIHVPFREEEKILTTERLYQHEQQLRSYITKTADTPLLSAEKKGLPTTKEMLSPQLIHSQHETADLTVADYLFSPTPLREEEEEESPIQPVAIQPPQKQSVPTFAPATTPGVDLSPTPIREENAHTPLLRELGGPTNYSMCEQRPLLQQSEFHSVRNLEKQQSCSSQLPRLDENPEATRNGAPSRYSLQGQDATQPGCCTTSTTMIPCSLLPTAPLSRAHFARQSSDPSGMSTAFHEQMDAAVQRLTRSMQNSMQSRTAMEEQGGLMLPNGSSSSSSHLRWQR